jgi:hypothetical protein
MQNMAVAVKPVASSKPAANLKAIADSKAASKMHRRSRTGLFFPLLGSDS